MAISSYFTLSYSSSAQLSRNLIPMKIKTRERRWEAKLNVGVESRVQSVDWIFVVKFSFAVMINPTVFLNVALNPTQTDQKYFGIMGMEAKCFGAAIRGRTVCLNQW